MAGFLSDNKIKILFDEIKTIDGAIAEIGVNEGSLFHRLIKLSKEQNKNVCAFDSFRGLDVPDSRYDDVINYPKGKFDIGGKDNFVDILKNQYNIEETEYNLFIGFIPDCLDLCKFDFSFIYIDLDHYQPTKLSIKWSKRKLIKGGILGFDDYFEGNEKGISPLIDQFILENKKKFRPILHLNDQIFFKKLY